MEKIDQLCPGKKTHNLPFTMNMNKETIAAGDAVKYVGTDKSVPQGTGRVINFNNDTAVIEFTCGSDSITVRYLLTTEYLVKEETKTQVVQVINTVNPADVVYDTLLERLDEDHKHLKRFFGALGAKKYEDMDAELILTVGDLLKNKSLGYMEILLKDMSLVDQFKLCLILGIRGKKNKEVGGLINPEIAELLTTEWSKYMLGDLMGLPMHIMVGSDTYEKRTYADVHHANSKYLQYCVVRLNKYTDETLDMANLNVALANQLFEACDFTRYS